MDGAMWGITGHYFAPPPVESRRRTSSGVSVSPTGSTSTSSGNHGPVVHKKPSFFGRKRPSTSTSGSISSSRLAPIPGSPPRSTALARENSAPSMVGHPTMLLSRGMLPTSSRAKPPVRPMRPSLTSSESAPAGLATLASIHVDDGLAGQTSEEENEASLRALWEITGAYETGWDTPSSEKQQPDFSAPASVLTAAYSLSPLDALPDNSPILSAATGDAHPLEVRLDSPEMRSQVPLPAKDESPTLPIVGLPNVPSLGPQNGGPAALAEVERLLRSLGLDGYELVPKAGRKGGAEDTAGGAMPRPDMAARLNDMVQNSTRHSVASSIGSTSTALSSSSRDRDRVFLSQFERAPTPPCRGSSLKPSSKPLPSSASVASMSSLVSDAPTVGVLGSPLRLPSRGSSKGKGKKPPPIAFTPLARVNSSPDLRRTSPSRFERSDLPSRPTVVPSGQIRPARRSSPSPKPVVRRTKSQPDMRATLKDHAGMRHAVHTSRRVVSSQTRSASTTPVTAQEANLVGFAGPSRAGSSSLRRSQRVTRQGSASLARRKSQSAELACTTQMPAAPATKTPVAVRPLDDSPRLGDSEPEDLCSMLETAKAWAWPAPPTPPPAIPLPPTPSHARMVAQHKRAGTILIPSPQPTSMSGAMSPASFAAMRSASAHRTWGSESSSTESHVTTVLTPAATTDSTVRSVVYPPSATLPALSIFDELAILDHEAETKRDMSDRDGPALAPSSAATLPPLEFSPKPSGASQSRPRPALIEDHSVGAKSAGGRPTNNLAKVRSNASSVLSTKTSASVSNKGKPKAAKRPGKLGRLIMDGMMLGPAL